MKHGLIALCASSIMAVALISTSPTQAAYVPPAERIDSELFQINATAYYNKYNCKTATGTWPREGYTIAGPEEWLGCTAILYDSEMNFCGYYQLDDTGYGKSIGWGNSKVLKGKHIGSIEAGQCVDIYMESKDDCMNFGFQKMYIRVIKAYG